MNELPQLLLKEQLIFSICFVNHLPELKRRPY